MTSRGADDGASRAGKWGKESRVPGHSVGAEVWDWPLRQELC